MEANVYFFAALVSTGIFLLQFILSIFFGSMDTDIDVNADGNADIDMSSVLSFKGLIHFCMGFGWFMYLCQPPYIVLHYLGAVISGSFFVFVLAWIYKLCYKLKQENKPEQAGNAKYIPAAKNKNRQEQTMWSISPSMAHKENLPCGAYRVKATGKAISSH